MRESILTLGMLLVAYLITVNENQKRTINRLKERNDFLEQIANGREQNKGGNETPGLPEKGIE